MAAVHLLVAGVCPSSTTDPSFPASARPCLPSSRLVHSNISFLSCSRLAGGLAVGPLSLIPARRHPFKGRHAAKYSSVAVYSAVRKLSEAELVLVPPEPEGLGSMFPGVVGVYGVYDGSGELQYVGISRNVAASIATHRKALPELCRAVKVGLIGEGAADRTVLTEAWKSWLQEHIETTGRVPPGNETGNNTWARKQQKKADLRLTPGRHVQLTVPLQQLIERLVRENKVVAFIKGSRSAPLCGFSQRVVGILESHGVDFESVDVLDEEYNYGLREMLKSYSNWPTFPQIFVRGELIGGCDILGAMEEKGEIETVFKN